jgi:hypothetical protein
MAYSWDYNGIGAAELNRRWVCLPGRDWVDGEDNDGLLDEKEIMTPGLIGPTDGININRFLKYTN